MTEQGTGRVGEKKEVTNERVLEIYANSDNFGVIQKVLKGWAKQLDHDVLTSCADDAVRKVIGYYDPNKPGAIKLTTALFREVNRVCTNAWDALNRAKKRQERARGREESRFRQKNNSKRFRYISPSESNFDAREQTQLILQDLAHGYRQIIQFYHFECLSFVEISKRLDISVDKCKERYECAMRAAKFVAGASA